MRALLLHNPTARSTSPALVELIAAALAADVKLDVEATKRRGHAGHLAAGAAHEGYDAVVVCGGDGTVNEVVQGVAHTPVRLGVIPGGSTNVYARLLGYSNDPVAAANQLRVGLVAGHRRRVHVGRAAGRLFAFNAGFGFDAAVVRAVERRPRLKRHLGQGAFLCCGALVRSGFVGRGPRVTVQTPGAPAVSGLRTAVCANADPFTFLGARPARLCPRAQLDGGLDALGATTLSTVALLRLLRAALAHDGDVTALRFTRSWHDVERLTLSADRPLPLQLDGDFVGEYTQVEVAVVPWALTVVPPPAPAHDGTATEPA